MKRLILLSAIGGAALFLGVIGSLPAVRADVVHLTDGTTISR